MNNTDTHKKEKINETDLFFGKDKPLVRLTKKKRERTKTDKIRTKRSNNINQLLSLFSHSVVSYSLAPHGL